jgi:hypothetical protein
MRPRPPGLFASFGSNEEPLRAWQPGGFQSSSVPENFRRGAVSRNQLLAVASYFLPLMSASRARAWWNGRHTRRRNQKLAI